MGDSLYVLNPVNPTIIGNVEREDFVLLMGRDDPVKGHEFAYSLEIEDLREQELIMLQKEFRP